MALQVSPNRLAWEQIMSKKRWMAAIVAEAKKTAEAPSVVLPFTRQARAVKRLPANPRVRLKSRASA